MPSGGTSRLQAENQRGKINFYIIIFSWDLLTTSKISPAVSSQRAERPKRIMSATYLRQKLSLPQAACLVFQLLHWATYPLCAFAGKEISCPTVFVWARI